VPGDRQGTRTITRTWTATDSVGKSASCTQTIKVVDITAPTITCPRDISKKTDQGACVATVDPGAATATDNSGSAAVSSVRSDGAALSAPYPKGVTTITWTATDPSGNTATGQQKVTVNDTEPPTIAAPAAVVVNTDAGECSRAKANVTLGTPTTADNCAVASVANDAPDLFPNGDTTVTWTVTDASGNTATATQKVTVNDTEKPILTVPAPLTVRATSINGAVVTFTPTATDNCSGVNVSSSPASGTLFPLGATPVVVTAADASGNTASRTFTVTVLADVVLNGPLTINSSTIKGSVELLAGKSVTLNSGASITGDLLVPGTPTLVKNGQSTLQGTIAGSGSTQPAGFLVTLNGKSNLRYLRTKMNPISMPTVAAPPAPTGTRTVTLNSPGQSAGDFSTLRNLSLNGNAGLVTIPPGSYGNFTANGGSGFVLGTAGSTQPALYNLQTLTLNSTARVVVTGPVILVLANSLNANGSVGISSQPGWLQLMIANGGITLNSGCTVAALVTAPTGTVIINGDSKLIGALQCNQLTINGGGLLQGTGN